MFMRGCPIFMQNDPNKSCFGVSLHGSKMHRLQVIQGSIAPSSTGKLQGNGHQHNYRHFFQMVNFLSEDPRQRTYRKHTDVLDESTAVPAVYIPRAIWIIYSFYSHGHGKHGLTHPNTARIHPSRALSISQP